MAHHLQKGLAPLLVLAAPLLAQEFPHKEALAKNGGVCQPCHAALLKSTEVSKRASRPVRWVKFNHEFHLKMGNVAPVLLKAIEGGSYLPGLGADPAAVKPHLEKATLPCMACHRGMASSTDARVAKANYPHMSDCLVCHNKIDNPFSCETCHVEDAKTLRPSSHMAHGFADGHSAKSVSKAECAVCHGRKFTCLGCH